MKALMSGTGNCFDNAPSRSRFLPINGVPKSSWTIIRYQPSKAIHPINAKPYD